MNAIVFLRLGKWREMNWNHVLTSVDIETYVSAAARPRLSPPETFEHQGHLCPSCTGLHRMFINWPQNPSNPATCPCKIWWESVIMRITPVYLCHDSYYNYVIIPDSSSHDLRLFHLPIRHVSPILRCLVFDLLKCDLRTALSKWLFLQTCSRNRRFLVPVKSKN